jgi:hypothetical protein
MFKQKLTQRMLAFLSLTLMLSVVWAASSSFTPAKEGAEGTITLTGRISTDYDIAVKGAKVTCEKVTTKTDAKGEFTLTIPDMKKESYKISYSKKGFMSDHMDDIKPDGEKIMITMMRQH